MPQSRARLLPKNGGQVPTTKRVVDLMLDSGAFGAWKRGESLDIHDYITYVKRHLPWLYSYVNMDVIPGANGVMDTSQATVEKSAQASYDNLQIMKKAGLSPIPVFHMGERWYWLERMLADGEPYIGISPYKSANMSAIIKWLDNVFTIITDAKGLPLCKTHGFGVTDQDLLLRYPWFTCDSTSWAIGPAYGHIPIPIYVKGKPDYYRHHRIVAISGVPQTGGSQKMQFEGLGPLSQEAVLKFLKEEVGCRVVDVRYDANLRRRAYLRFYQRLLENTICAHFKHRQSSLHFKPPSKLKAKGPWHVKIMFATNLSHGQYARLMTNVGANNRLISYYDCREMRDEKLHGYVDTGLLPGYRPILTPKPSWDNETYLIKRRFSLLSRLEDPHEHNRFAGKGQDSPDDT